MTADKLIAKACEWWLKGGRHSALCSQRDVFQARLDYFLKELLTKKIPEDLAYLFVAMIGELGNNSFDHNLGQWQDVPGCVFDHCIEDSVSVLIADRGQGIFSSLKHVLPKLTSDAEALKIAFYQKISGRSPERRGNGLKFVNNALSSLKKCTLLFLSGEGFLELGDKNNLLCDKMRTKLGGRHNQGVLCLLNYEN